MGSHTSTGYQFSIQRMELTGKVTTVATFAAEMPVESTMSIGVIFLRFENTYRAGICRIEYLIKEYRVSSYNSPRMIIDK
jgi:hypothetical protein